jgi:DNA-binding MarR family transcriptional regulator
MVRLLLKESIDHSLNTPSKEDKMRTTRSVTKRAKKLTVRVKTAVAETPMGEEEYRLWSILNQASWAVSTARRKELARYRMSWVQNQVLGIIDTLGKNVRTGEISRLLLRRYHSTSELLDRMEEKGMVKKIRSPYTRKGVKVELTDKGRRLYDRTIDLGAVSDIFTALTPRERKQLFGFLEKLRNRAVTEYGVEKPPYP